MFNRVAAKYEVILPGLEHQFTSNDNDACRRDGHSVRLVQIPLITLIVAHLVLSSRGACFVDVRASTTYYLEYTIDERFERRIACHHESCIPPP